MSYEEYQHLRVEVNDGIALVTFNRPEVLNAVNSRMHAELRDIFYDLRRDPAVNVVVTTGAGRAYLAGGELEMLEDALNSPAAAAQIMDEARDAVWNLIELDKPLIAAVNGPTVGTGCQIALASDMIFASEKASFCDGHSRAGLAAGDGGVFLWPMLVGMARAKQYLLTSDWVTAQEAERIGLVNKVVAHDHLLPEAMAFAQRLAAGPLYAMRLTKRALHQWYRLFAMATFEYSAQAELTTFSTSEAKEGIQALKERRAPIWPPLK